MKPLKIEVKLREQQKEIIENLPRFAVIVAHRRFGKTVLCLLYLLRQALRSKRKNPRFHYYCPSFRQAKQVAWTYLKDWCAVIPGTTFNESELRVDLPNGARIQLGSAENPDASRGIYSDGVVLDEPAQMPSRMWTEVLRPALSDRQGWAIMIGTPQGRHGLFYDSYEAAGELKGWRRYMYKASETGIVDAAELEAAKALMTAAEYSQEFECSFSAAIRGAYYGDTMNELEAGDHMTTLVPIKARPVHCSFDLGYSDATAVWFFQIDGQRVNLLDYVEYTNLGLPDITAELRRKPYNYGKMIVPHDAGNHSLSTGETRDRTMRELGWDTILVTRCAPGMMNQEIEQTRSFLHQCWFDRVNCRDGIEALRQYSSAWKDKQGVLSLKPTHDWASHGADSMRYLAMCGIKRIVGTWDARPPRERQPVLHHTLKHAQR